MTIGERVKILRTEKNMTQEELAEKLGYKSKSSVAHIENGRDIPRSMIVKLADILGTSPAYLMGWEDKWDKESERFEEQINNREATLHEVLSAYLDEPKDRETAIEIIRQFSRLNNEGLKKLLERELELVELGYISDIEKELKQQ